MLITSCSNIQQTPSDDHWFAADKAKHLAVSASLGAALVNGAEEQNCQRVLASVSLVMLLGYGKEEYDQHIKQTYFSYKDMVWNFIGSSLGAISASDC